MKRIVNELTTSLQINWPIEPNTSLQSSYSVYRISLNYAAKNDHACALACAQVCTSSFSYCFIKYNLCVYVSVCVLMIEDQKGKVDIIHISRNRFPPPPPLASMHNNQNSSWKLTSWISHWSRNVIKGNSCHNHMHWKSSYMHEWVHVQWLYCVVCTNHSTLQCGMCKCMKCACTQEFMTHKCWPWTWHAWLLYHY